MPVRAALAEGRFTHTGDGRLLVEGELLGLGDVLLSYEGTPGHVVSDIALAYEDPTAPGDGDPSRFGAVVVLETALTPSSGRGPARELTHRLNVMRKDAGFAIEDRIAPATRVRSRRPSSASASCSPARRSRPRSPPGSGHGYA